MNLLPETRHSLLIRLARAEDSAAWGEFLDVYEKAIYRFACSRGLQPNDAADVTQQVLQAVVKKVQDWDTDAERGSFGAWLFCVTRNLASKCWNERAKQPQQFLDVDACIEDLQDASKSDSMLFHAEYRRVLFHWAADRVREQVKTSTWMAFHRTAVEHASATHVADELGISIASVYTAKCRIMARIRNEIEEFEAEFSGNKERK